MTQQYEQKELSCLFTIERVRNGLCTSRKNDIETMYVCVYEWRKGRRYLFDADGSFPLTPNVKRRESNVKYEQPKPKNEHFAALSLFTAPLQQD